MYNILRAAGSSLFVSFPAFLRAIIALIVIAATWWMTYKELRIPEEWQAVFLIVLGFYFAERPSGEIPGSGEDRKKLRARGGRDQLLLSELTWQFILATVLVVGAIAAFLCPEYDGKIEAAWLAGVVLAVGFYFKEAEITSEPDRWWLVQTIEIHQVYRAIVALLVTGGTIPLVVAASGLKKSSPNSEIDGVPLQWITVVLIVVAFYFKEMKDTPLDDDDHQDFGKASHEDVEP